MLTERRIRRLIASSAEDDRTFPARGTLDRPEHQRHLRRRLGAFRSAATAVLLGAALAACGSVAPTDGLARAAEGADSCQETPTAEAGPECAAELGAVGTLPPLAWRLLSERQESVPTGTDDVVDSVTRTYLHTETDVVIYSTVTFGDVTPVTTTTAATYGAEAEPGIRPGYEVFRAPGTPAFDFQWSIDDRTVIQITGDTDNLPEDVLRLAVQQVQLEP